MEENILVVDDCRTTRKIISLYLNSAGYKTVMAANGVEAVEKLINTKVDFIITDLNMPQMDGFELTKWVRGNTMFRDIPLIILTTEQDDMSLVKGISNGVSAYLNKPITKERLINEVKQIIAKCKGS